ncbi:MAG: BrnT family toxin [Nitrospirota bacterium]|nr:BrnT family toxin [Nitrospirota bacterium]MDE3241919.1 BrnT family toxin [Nitrospirota bacterium]
MVFEWDPGKATVNLTKHGVSFEEATSVFADDDALDGEDILHSIAEQRFLRLGKSSAGRILVVAYTVRRKSDGEATRIISARQANRKEKAAYRQDSAD